MDDFPMFHDATLRGISVDSESGEARLECETSSGPLAIVATTVRSLRWSRTMWGTSNSINEVVLKATKNAKMLRVEMQSGDQVEITCENAIAATK